MAVAWMLALTARHHQTGADFDCLGAKIRVR